jgi:hypothetical protein
MKDVTDKFGGRFKTAMAFMIAFVTIMSAVAAWRAAVAAGDASNADVAGLAAAVNLEEARALNSQTAYQHFRAFTAYLRYNTLGNLIAEDMANASDEAWPILDRERGTFFTLAVQLEGTFFPKRYLNPENGNYDVQREIGGLLANDEQAKDIHPLPHFEKADRMRTKSNWLVAVLVAFAVALWFFTLAEGWRHVLKYVLALGGLAFTFIGVAGLVALELWTW